MFKELIEEILKAELTEEIGYSKHDYKNKRISTLIKEFVEGKQKIPLQGFQKFTQIS